MVFCCTRGRVFLIGMSIFLFSAFQYFSYYLDNWSSSKKLFASMNLKRRTTTNILNSQCLDISISFPPPTISLTLPFSLSNYLHGEKFHLERVEELNMTYRSGFIFTLPPTLAHRRHPYTKSVFKSCKRRAQEEREEKWHTL